MHGENSCPEPPSNDTYEPPSTWTYFKICHGITKALIGEAESSTKHNVRNAMHDKSSPYHDVRKYAWRDVTFLLVYFTLLVTALLILLSFSYRLLYHWSRVRRKSRRRPRSLVSGYLVLLCGTAAAVLCMIIFWKGLISIQTRQYKRVPRVSDEYISKYEAAVSCGAKLSENEALKGSHISKRSSDNATVAELWASEATLKTFVNLTSKCNIPEVNALRHFVERVEMGKKSRKRRDSSDSGDRVKAIIADYLAQVNTILSELKTFVNNQQQGEEDFILANEYSSVLKFALLLILALPAVLFLLCLSGVIILATYTIMEQTRDGPPNDTVNEFLSVILQTYGYVNMVVSAVFFLIAALLLVTGFSSIFICDMVLTDNNDDADPYYSITVVLRRNRTMLIDLRDASHRCRRYDRFHEAFLLHRILTDNSNIASSKSKRENTEKLTIGGLQKHLSVAANLTFLKNDSCMAGHKDDFDDVMKQIKDKQSRLMKIPKDEPPKHVKPKRNTTGPRSGVSPIKAIPLSKGFKSDINNDLLLYSPQCVQLASSLTTSRRFCKTKPPYFQGLWIACALTGMMSIHTYAVMFDGSDMVRPKEHSSETDEKKKESTGTRETGRSENDRQSKDEVKPSKEGSKRRKDKSAENADEGKGSKEKE